jgi:hypothetical protein
VEDVLHDCQHFLCFRHIMNNLRDKVRGVNKQVARLCWQVQSAWRVARYDSKMEELRQLCPEAAQFLEDLEESDASMWSTAHALRVGKRTYGMRTNNLVEQENSRLRPWRRMHPLQLLIHVGHLWGRLLSEMVDQMKSADQRPSFIMPEPRKMYVSELDQSHERAVHWGVGDRVVVYVPGAEDVSLRTVDFETMGCECGEWFGRDLPCRHGCAAALVTGRLHEDHYSEWYANAFGLY